MSWCSLLSVWQTYRKHVRFVAGIQGECIQWLAGDNYRASIFSGWRVTTTGRVYSRHVNVQGDVSPLHGQNPLHATSTVAWWMQLWKCNRHVDEYVRLSDPHRNTGRVRGHPPHCLWCEQGVEWSGGWEEDNGSRDMGLRGREEA